jgi:ABC-2 type transport system ATP-binding protein
MIQVEHLTKCFGSLRAIEDVSFRVEPGEILGFLGPNGAGKTTTMRILAGFFPATDGTAQVAGYDVFAQPLEAKRRVGYLPENPPLYTEMSVDSYLRFVARIKGVKGVQIDSRVDYVKERCGLLEEGHRLIRHLSKGYRQRVGLAQALVHNPEVLILDEPTIGLDPKQIIEVRNLIKSLGGDHTVILSTHILPEVSMTCERVTIINNGKIVAVDTPENLTNQLSGGQRIEVEVAGSMEMLPQVINTVPMVKMEGLPEGVDGLYRLTLVSEGQEEVRNIVSRKLIEAGFEVYGLRAEGMTLEQVFLKLTTEEVTE